MERYFTCLDVHAGDEQAILWGEPTDAAPGARHPAEDKISKQGKAENGWRRTASTATDIVV
ncbi:MAG: hypothetical protein V4597_15835 [Pseudomonadota bacterium]